MPGFTPRDSAHLNQGTHDEALFLASSNDAIHCNSGAAYGESYRHDRYLFALLRSAK
jgi:hypothetical protein